VAKSYSLDLRALSGRANPAIAASNLEVLAAFVVRLMAAYQGTGSLAPKPWIVDFE
jgi:hypothetical protein